MANYATGEQTQEAILSAARTLFYASGYKRTRCDQIAGEANINPGLIHYHFKTKGNIALRIYSDYFQKIRNCVTEMFGDKNAALQAAIEVRILWKLVEDDPNILRFFQEIAGDRIPQELSEQHGREYFVELSKENPTETSEDMYRLLCICSIAMESELFLSCGSNQSPFSFTELSSLDIRSMFELLRFPPDVIQDVLQQSGEAVQQLDVFSSASFNIQVQRKA